MHSIHLRHPWKSKPHGEGSHWSRKFNWPARLESNERIHLVIQSTTPISSITLNDNPLVAGATSQDVTPYVSHHNLLTLTHPEPPPQDPRDHPFAVRLEIVSDVESNELHQ